MSSFLYGSLSRQRQATSPRSRLAMAESAPGGTSVAPVGGTATGTVSHWQDALTALVPAEVLALHAVAMTIGTTTSGTGAGRTTVITAPGEMRVVFGVLVLMAFGLYLVGAKSAKGLDLLRAGIAAAAFVLWTMIQPSTAFDALGLETSSLVRVMVAVVGAVLLAAAVDALARKADAATG
jgi:hypothetical protein